MDPSPLLVGHTETSGTDLLDRLHRLRRFEFCPKDLWKYVFDRLHLWWSITRNPDYLASWVSRRHLQKWFLFSTMVQTAVMRIMSQEASNLTSRVCFCILVLILPTHVIWRDFVVMVAFLYTIMVDFFSNNIAALSAEDFLWQMWMPCSWGVLVLSFLGLHSSAVFCFNLGGMLVLANYDHWDPSIGFKGFTTAVMNLPLILIVEFCLAYVFDDLQHKQKTLEVLLDKATNGFCSIEAPMGIIRSASPQLERTLGASAKIVGRPIYDFLQVGDHSSIEELLADPSEVQNLNAKLVTCLQDPSGSNHHGQVKFDAKIIPFAMSSRVLQICFQLQGEMRVQREESIDSGTCSQSSDYENDNNKESSSSSMLGKKVLQSSTQSCAEERLSEFSFSYTVTESVVSAGKGPQARVLSPKTLGVWVAMQDAGVQTGERKPTPPGNDPDMDFSPKLFPSLLQHSDQICADAELRALERQRPLRPPTLPGNLKMLDTRIQAASLVSRGRSLSRRERPLPKPRGDMTLACARPLLQPTGLQCEDEHAEPTHQSIAPSPMASVGIVSQAPPARRKRRGQDIKKLDDTPIDRA